MYPFEHFNASNLLTAFKLLKEPETEALAGGTDLLGELKRRIKKPKRLVNLKTIPGLNRIRHDKKLSLGPLVTLAEIEHHPIISEKFVPLAQAASFAATPQLRHMGTLAGNLCQHPRCWYYRSPLFNCWLKGGAECFAVQGENKYHAILGGEICHAVHASDLAPALIALGARVKVDGFNGKRQILLEDLYTKPSPKHRQMTVLNRGELITEVTVPSSIKTSKGIYLKAMERQAWAFALVSVAVQMNFEDGQVEQVRLVLGGVAPIPWRAKGAEKILTGQKLSQSLIESAGEAALAGAKPLRDNLYKVQLLKSLIRQALHAVWPR